MILPLVPNQEKKKKKKGNYTGVLPPPALIAGCVILCGASAMIIQIDKIKFKGT